MKSLVVVGIVVVVSLAAAGARQRPASQAGQFEVVAVAFAVDAAASFVVAAGEPAEVVSEE